MGVREGDMATLVSVRRPVHDLRPGDHALLTFAGNEEQRYVVGAFVESNVHVKPSQ